MNGVACNSGVTVRVKIPGGIERNEFEHFLADIITLVPSISLLGDMPAKQITAQINATEMSSARTHRQS